MGQKNGHIWTLDNSASVNNELTTITAYFWDFEIEGGVSGDATGVYFQANCYESFVSGEN